MVGAAKESATGGLDASVNDILSVVLARSRGEVSNDEVENALETLLAQSKEALPPSAAKTRPTQVEEDNDDYDNEMKHQKSDGVKDDTKVDEVDLNGKIATLESLKEDADSEVELFSDVPMGPEGKRMLETFGDGPHPKLETVKAALLGTRRCLQVAVKDARALRRKAKREYAKARQAMHMGEKKIRLSKELAGVAKTKRSEGVDPTLLYRAIQRNDRLCYDPKCGFDVEQLQDLFPEEMNAYNRWNEVSSAPNYAHTKLRPSSSYLELYRCTRRMSHPARRKASRKWTLRRPLQRALACQWRQVWVATYRSVPHSSTREQIE